jgi:beta-glucosidase
VYHWDLPQALQDRGGWPNRDTALRFADYAQLLFEAFGETVPLWITINEPWVASWLGYATGEHAPGVSDTKQALAAAHHLLLGHGLAVERFRATARADQQVGITLNLTPFSPASHEPADVRAAQHKDGNQNRWFLDPVFGRQYPADMLEDYGRTVDLGFVHDGDLATIAAPIDFLGVNYYMRYLVHADEAGQPVTTLGDGVPATAMGWGIEPRGLTDVLVRLAREYPPVPLYVTENGAAFYDYVDPEGSVDDVERIAFLAGHFRAAHAAIQAGVDLRGFFVWSLLDNFEWALGYSRRFGLVYVEYGTQARIPKSSATWYAGIARANALPDTS